MNNSLPIAPHHLMDHMEHKLRDHIKRKNRCRKTVITSTIIAVILIFSFNQQIKSYASNFLDGFINGIHTAIDHNQGTSINKTFSVNNVHFTFKNIVADETGIAICYEVDNDNYRLGSVEVLDENNNIVDDEIPYAPQIYTLHNDKERILHLPPIEGKALTVKVGKIINFMNDNTEKTFLDQQVNWEFSTPFTKRNAKIVELNEEIQLDRGKLVLQNLQLGVMTSNLHYQFIPNENEDIKAIHLGAYIQSGKTYYEIYKNDSCDDTNASEKMLEWQSGPVWYENSKPFESVIEFAPLIYDKVKNLEFILMHITYMTQIDEEFHFSSEELPKTFDLLGTDLKIISMKIEEEEEKRYTAANQLTPAEKRYMDYRTEIVMELGRENRAFDYISDWSFKVNNKNHVGACLKVNNKNHVGACLHGIDGPIQRVDETEFQKGIEKLTKIIPQFKERMTKLTSYDGTSVALEASVQGPHDELTFRIENVSKTIIYAKTIDIKVK